MPKTNKEYIREIKATTKEQRKAIKQREQFQRQREYEANKKIIAYEQRLQPKNPVQSLNKSIGNKVGRGFSFIRNPARVLYQYQGQERPKLAPNPYRSSSNRSSNSGRSGGRGRPYGTVKYVNPQTGQPIGVYEYRKILSAQLRGQRMQQNFQNTLSPRQQQVLAQSDAQQRFQQSNIESRPIPDTNGQVNLRSIHQEADAYAHLFD